MNRPGAYSSSSVTSSPTTNDQLDVSGMTDAGGDPVNAWDVIITDTNGDGTGDAILTFPNGESISLVWIIPELVDSASELSAIGIPCFTPGTLVTTEHGEVSVEDIRPGDMVLTVDDGLQPVRWVGERKLTQVILPTTRTSDPSDVRQASAFYAEGAPTESFYPGPVALGSVKSPALFELLSPFPDLARQRMVDAGPELRATARL